MADHRRSESGVCQRCGHVPTRDPAAETCAPRVVYVPSLHRVQDFIAPNGVTFYGRKTLEQCQAEHPDAVVMDADAAYELHAAHLRAPVSETTAERFNYALEVLPPGKYGHYARGLAFYVTERITANIVSWYFEVAGRYFTLDDDATLHPSALIDRVCEYIAAHPVAPAVEVTPAG
jgi:hypothetical protein